MGLRVKERPAASDAMSPFPLSWLEPRLSFSDGFVLGLCPISLDLHWLRPLGWAEPGSGFDCSIDR